MFLLLQSREALFGTFDKLSYYRLNLVCQGRLVALYEVLICK